MNVSTPAENMTAPSLYNVTDVTLPSPYNVTDATLPSPYNVTDITWPPPYNVTGVTLPSPYNVTDATLDAHVRDLTDREIIYVACTGATSLLSVAGCLVIIAVDIVFKDLRSPGRRLLTFLCVADGLTAAGNALGVAWSLFRDSEVIHASMMYCRFQSALTIFSSISSFSWMVVIAINLLVAIVFSRPQFTVRFAKVFHLVCWTPGAVMAVLALALGVLGYDRALRSSWCWIDPHVQHAFLWQLMTGKAWEMSAYVTTALLYAVVRVFLFRKSRSSSVKPQSKSRDAALSEANRKLMYVPLVFVVVRMWGTARFLIGVFDHAYASSPDSFWIAPLQGIGDSAQGFANCLIYCLFTRSVRHRLLAACGLGSGRVEPGFPNGRTHTQTEKPPTRTHTELPSMCTHTEQPSMCTHTEQPPMCTHTEQPSMCTHTEQPSMCTHTEQPPTHACITEAEAPPPSFAMGDLDTDVVGAEGGGAQLDCAHRSSSIGSHG